MSISFPRESAAQSSTLSPASSPTSPRSPRSDRPSNEGALALVEKKERSIDESVRPRSAQLLTVARNIDKEVADQRPVADDTGLISSSQAATAGAPSVGVARVENSLAELQIRAGNQYPVRGTGTAFMPTLMDRIEQWGECVPHAEFVSVVADILAACGLEARQARAAGEILVDAQLSGAGTHGVFHLSMYTRGLLDGRINARPAMRVSGGETSCITLNADNALGVLAAQHAIDLLLPSARRHGVAAVAVCNSNHYGLAAHFVERAARENLVCLTTSNATPTMAAYGGIEPLFGTNPIAASFPNPLGQPVTVDMATSAVARGQLRRAQREGRSIPADWALDAQGRPTTDPVAALQGTMQPAAGPKGYGLALTAELLASALAGGRPGFEVASPFDRSREAGVSHFFLALDPGRFAGLDSYAHNVAAVVDRVHASPGSTPGVPLRVPGERAQSTREQRQRDGIPLTAGLRQAVVEAATQLSARSN